MEEIAIVVHTAALYIFHMKTVVVLMTVTPPTKKKVKPPTNETTI